MEADKKNKNILHLSLSEQAIALHQRGHELPIFRQN
jgi:hypothetical protein